MRMIDSGASTSDVIPGCALDDLVVFGFEGAEKRIAKVAELVDALVLGTSGGTRESSSLSFRTIRLYSRAM